MSLSLVLAYSLSLTLITSLTCGLSHSFSELAVSFLSHSLCLFLDWSSLSHRGCLLYSLMVVALSLSRCLLSRPLPHSLSLSLPPPPSHPFCLTRNALAHSLPLSRSLSFSLMISSALLSHSLSISYNSLSLVVSLTHSLSLSL